MVELLALGALFKMLEAAASSVLMATGHPRAPAVSSGVKAVALLLLLPSGYRFYGLPGLLGALAASDLIRYVVTVSALRRRGLCVLRYDLALLLCAALITAVARYAGRHPRLPANDWIQLGVAGGVVLALWGLTLGGWALTRQAQRTNG